MSESWAEVAAPLLAASSRDEAEPLAALIGERAVPGGVMTLPGVAELVSTLRPGLLTSEPSIRVVLMGVLNRVARASRGWLEMAAGGVPSDLARDGLGDELATLVALSACCEPAWSLVAEPEAECRAVAYLFLGECGSPSDVHGLTLRADIEHDPHALACLAQAVTSAALRAEGEEVSALLTWVSELVGHSVRPVAVRAALALQRLPRGSILAVTARSMLGPDVGSVTLAEMDAVAWPFERA